MMKLQQRQLERSLTVRLTLRLKGETSPIYIACQVETISEQSTSEHSLLEILGFFRRHVSSGTSPSPNYLTC